MSGETAAASREKVIEELLTKEFPGARFERAPLNSLLITKSGSEYFIFSRNVVLGPERDECPDGTYQGLAFFLVQYAHELRPRLVEVDGWWDDTMHVSMVTSQIVTQHYDA